MSAEIFAIATAALATFTTEVPALTPEVLAFTAEVLAVTIDLNFVSITEAELVTGVKARSTIFATELVEIDASATTVTAIGASADFKALETTFLKALASAKFVYHFVNIKRAATVVCSGATLRLSFQEATMFAAT